MDFLKTFKPQLILINSVIQFVGFICAASGIGDLTSKQSLGWFSLILCVSVAAGAIASIFHKDPRFISLFESLCQVATLVVTIKTDPYTRKNANEGERAAAAGFIMSAICQYIFLFLFSIGEDDKGAAPTFTTPEAPQSSPQGADYYSPYPSYPQAPPPVVYPTAPQNTESQHYQSTT
eukprot:TRINITY_DN2969_c0_g1_i3.p1 TRINITY_DN2969_c0_g1~~TRINITY_DN2969_c0_g1_i3.p1  ORF type:complete len:178 (-),score=65.37 TRINITY_DN2969_c0_g1_i3:150-683(-)